MMRKAGSILLAGALFTILAVVASAPAPGAQKKFITISSARPGGSWYISGAGWAEMLNKYIPGLEAKVEQSGGGVQNNKLVSDGATELGISVGPLSVQAVQGTGPFAKTGKLPNIRLLINRFSTGVLQFAALESSGIKTVCDLKGKRVALGPAGGGGIPAAIVAFEACGFGLKDITASYMSYEQGKDELVDRNLDACLSYAAVPVPALKALEVTPAAKWRLLPLPGEKAAEIERKIPGYIRYVIPAAAYGRPADIVTIGTPNILIVNKDVPDDLVYQITKVTVGRLEEFRKIEPTHTEMTKENAAKAFPGLVFHPGAVRYYKEAGLM